MSAALSGATGAFAPSSPASVLPTIVADQLPSSRAVRRRRPRRSRARRRGCRCRSPRAGSRESAAARACRVHRRRAVRAPGSREPAVAGRLVDDRSRRDDELPARRGSALVDGSAPDGVRDPERVAAPRARAAVRAGLIRGERGGDVRGLRMGLRPRPRLRPGRRGRRCEPEERASYGACRSFPLSLFARDDLASP